MGIFDFLKPKSSKKEIKKISENEIESFIASKSSELEKKESDFNKNLTKEIKNLVDTLNSQIKTLENINWKKIREDEKTKHTVRENLENYTSHLSQLISDLNKISEDNLDQNKITRLFFSFEKKSKFNFQKATYLIGKELDDVNNSIRGFLSSLNEIYRNSNSPKKEIDTISEIKNDLEKIEEISSALKEKTSDLKKSQNEISEKESKIRDMESKFKELENSPEQILWLSKFNKIERLKLELNKNLRELQDISDLKYLAKIWHTNDKSMDLIKEYRHNFKDAFNKDLGVSLIKLSENSKTLDPIKEKINEIKSLKEKISETNLGKSPKEKIREKIQGFQTEIQSINNEIQSQNSTIKKLETSKEELFNSVKDKIKVFEIEVE